MGAITAACLPLATARLQATAATAVFPEPTSPWRSRFIGSGAPMSLAISPITRRWAPVGANGRIASARSSAAGETSKAWPGSTRTPRAFSARPTERRSSSS